MAVDREAKKLWSGGPWAETGDRVDPESSSVQPVLSRTLGFPASYSTTNTPARTRINQILRELSGAAIEVRNGVSEYDEEVRYPVNAIVQHGGNLWRANVVHNPSSPVSPADSGQSNWVAMTGSGGNVDIPNEIQNNEILIDNDNASSFAVYWFAPADNGSPITRYDVRYSKSSTFASGVYTLTNYTQGTPITANVDAGRADLYYVQVRATNGQGTRDWPTSVGKRVINSPLLPESINYFNASPSSGSVRLDWGLPFMHGLVLNRYVIEWKTGAQTFSTSANPARHQYITNGNTFATISGLTNGTSYDFRITAESTAGTSNVGSYTVSSTPTTGASVSDPDAVSNFTAVQGINDHSIFVSTSSTPDDGGSKITSYQFQYRTVGASWPTSLTNDANFASADVPFYTWESLANVELEFRMRAVNAVNANKPNTSWSGLVKRTPFYPSVPDAPVLVGQGSITPSTGGGIIAYVAQDIAENGGNITEIGWERKLTSEGSDAWASLSNGTINLSLLKTDETAGTSVDIRCRARNSAGWGDYSNEVSIDPPGTTPGSIDAPDAPSIEVRAYEGTGRMLLTLKTLTDDNNADISRYIWQSKIATASDSTYANITPVATTDQPYKLSENNAYTVGTNYKFRAYAVNSSGTSAKSNEPTLVAANNAFTLNVPDKPSLGVNLLPRTGVENNATILLYINRRLDYNNSPINDYTFEASGQGLDDGWNVIANERRFPFYIWQGGSPGHTYQFRVLATNTVGDSEYSNTQSILARRADWIEGPPNITSIGASLSGRSLSWSITVDQNGSSVNNMVVSATFVSDNDGSNASRSVTYSSLQTSGQIFSPLGLVDQSISVSITVNNAFGGDTRTTNA